MSSLFENTLVLHQATIILRQIFDFCVVACDDLEDSRSHVTSPTNVKGQKGQNKLSKTTSFHGFRISIVISRGINKSIQWFWEKVALWLQIQHHLGALHHHFKQLQYLMISYLWQMESSNCQMISIFKVRKKQKGNGPRVIYPVILRIPGGSSCSSSFCGRK